MELFWILVSMVVLLLRKGLFSGSEIALVNADKIKLNARANQGHPGASHTVGGLVMTRLRRIPVQGESIVESGYRFTVEEASERTVLKLRVAPVGAGTAAPASDGEQQG